MNRDESSFAIFFNINHIDDFIAGGPLLFSKDSRKCDSISDPKSLFYLIILISFHKFEKCSQTISKSCVFIILKV